MLALRRISNCNTLDQLQPVRCATKMVIWRSPLPKRCPEFPPLEMVFLCKPLIDTIVNNQSASKAFKSIKFTSSLLIHITWWELDNVVLKYAVLEMGPVQTAMCNKDMASAVRRQGSDSAWLMESRHLTARGLHHLLFDVYISHSLSPQLSIIYPIFKSSHITITTPYLNLIIPPIPTPTSHNDINTRYLPPPPSHSSPRHNQRPPPSLRQPLYHPNCHPSDPRVALTSLLATME